MLLIVFIVFLIGRFGLGKCDATLDKDSETYIPGNKGAYLCWSWLLGLFLLASLSITMIGNIGYLQESVSATSILVKSSANMTSDSVAIKAQAKKGFNDEYFPEDYTKRFG